MICCTCSDAWVQNNFIRCSSEKWMRLNTVKERKTKERKKEEKRKNKLTKQKNWKGKKTKIWREELKNSVNSNSIKIYVYPSYSSLRVIRYSPFKVYFKIGLILNIHALNIILHYTFERYDFCLSFAFIMRSLPSCVFRLSHKYGLVFFTKSGDFPKERENRICQSLSRSLCK